MSLKRNPLIFTPRPLAAGLGVVALTAGGMLLSPVVISPAVAENTPISSPGSYQGYKTVSGQVFVDRSGPRGELDGKQSWTAYDDSDVPLSGVKSTRSGWTMIPPRLFPRFILLLLAMMESIQFRCRIGRIR